MENKNAPLKEEKIPSITKKGDIKTNDLLTIHKIVTKGTLQNDSGSGVFRDRQVFVGRRIVDGTSIREIVEYMPPQAKDVPELVKEFIDWLNLDKSSEMNPVLLAGIVHYEIVRIHPFIDGNGRTARLFATLVLYLSGFDHRRIFALDDFYDRDRKMYYAVLKTVQTNNNDLTQWLEYFSTGVAISITEVKDAVFKLGTAKKISHKKQIGLIPRQMRIVEYINAKGKVTNKDLRGLFKISAQAVHKELTKLVGLEVIKPKGQGRALCYILV